MTKQLHKHPPDKEDLFELLVDSSTDFAIFTMDSDGFMTSWNIGAERLFGYTESEIVGRSADMIFTSEDRNAGAPETERVQARRTGRASDERWHKRKDGSRFWASGLLMPLRAPSEGFVKITQDRTEQHRTDERVRENEERFRLLATSIPQLVFRTYADGTRTWGSPQWIDFTGLSLEESLGFGWLNAIHPEDQEKTLTAWRAAQEEGKYYIEHRVRRNADGEYRWHQTRARPIDGQSGVPTDWVGTMTDIHDLRELQARQQVLMAELQHRTRNLLAVVQSIASHTIRSSVSLEVFEIEFGRRLQALGRVQGLLARGENSGIDLRTLVTAELAAHADRDMESGKVTVAGPPVVLPTMAAQVLGLALHELATNAVKYGALVHTPGKLSVSWDLDTEGTTSCVVLKWLERGVPMPAIGTAMRKGYGRELIERALPYQLNAKTKLDFGPDGVRCAISVPVHTDRSAHV